MNLGLGEFCEVVAGLKRPNAEKALLILWYYDCATVGVSKTSGELARILVDYHLGNPHSTQLAKQVKATKLATESKAGFSLKPGSRKVIRAWLPAGLDGMQPPMDHSLGYLPEAVWRDTRRYIESVCRQLNGCFSAAYFDAALVMLRRLLETLVIEAYEALGREAEIKAGEKDYAMFGKLVERATAPNGLRIGRNTKNALEAVKALGDKSAHDRRFCAGSADLKKIQFDVRGGVQDLISLASLQKHA